MLDIPVVSKKIIESVNLPKEGADRVSEDAMKVGRDKFQQLTTHRKL
jgi:hypothetical protein